MNILECSSKGDKRFSAFWAVVKVYGVKDTIEHHYQNCKMVNGKRLVFRGVKPEYIEVNSKKLDIKYLTPLL